MAITFAASKNKQQASLGYFTLKLIPITLDNSYPTGGYPLPKNLLGADAVLAVECDAASAPAGTQAVIMKYDATNAKLQAFWANTAGVTSLQEVTAGTNLSTFVCTLKVYCRGMGE